jgi:hypothetical protein
MDFVAIPGGTFDLGWRFALPKQIRDNTDTASAVESYIAMCSEARKVTLPPFQIARHPLPISELIGDPYRLVGVATLKTLCDLVDERLASDALRLPTEDELEFAAGGTLFPWGDLIPDGIPYGNETSFLEHKKPNAFGLLLLGDPYKVELCRNALKFGDGGVAICGGDSWPLAWLALSPSFRLTDREISECFPETLEQCYVRPVRDA